LSISPGSSRKNSDVSVNSENSPQIVTMSEKHDISTDYFQPETSCGSSPLSKPCTSLSISHKYINEGSQRPNFLRENSSSTLKVTTLYSGRKPLLVKEKSVPSSLSRGNKIKIDTHFTRKNGIEIDDEGWNDIFDEEININLHYNLKNKIFAFKKYSG